MWEWFKNQLYKVQRQDAEAKQIALHLSRALCYEWAKEEILYPDLRDKFKALSAAMAALEKPIILIEAFRTVKKQQEYYNKGRDRPGAIITNAKSFESYHQYALAFDVAFKDLYWAVPKEWWNVLGEEGKKLGLIWGGDWGDIDHFEWHPGFSYEELKKYFEIPK